MVLVLLILSIPVAAIAGGVVFFSGYGLLASILAYSLAGAATILLLGIDAMIRKDEEIDQFLERTKSWFGGVLRIE